MTIIDHVSRRLAYTDEQLDRLALEFAEYAALDIADIARWCLPPAERDYRLGLVATEIAHAIRCTIDTLTVTPAPLHPYHPQELRALAHYEPLKARA